MKKVLSLCLALFLILGQSVVFAQPEALSPLEDQVPVVFDSVEEKKALATRHADKKLVGLSEEEINKRTREVERTLNELAANLAAGKESRTSAVSMLEEMGVYILETPVPESEGISILSTGTDITLNAVMITYDSYTSRWTVTGGGYWKNKNWYSDKPGSWIGYPGETKNVGGVDSVGVTYYNTGGTYSTAVVSSLGYVTDHNGWTEEMYNPSHGDAQYGVAFDFQDKMRMPNFCGVCFVDDFTYLGSGFAASVTYDSGFSNYSGYARTLYAHTWNSTTVNKVNFNVTSGGTFGASIEFSSSSNRFQIFNGSDTTF